MAELNATEGGTSNDKSIADKFLSAIAKAFVGEDNPESFDYKMRNAVPEYLRRSAAMDKDREIKKTISKYGDKIMEAYGKNMSVNPEPTPISIATEENRLAEDTKYSPIGGYENATYGIPAQSKIDIKEPKITRPTTEEEDWWDSVVAEIQDPAAMAASYDRAMVDRGISTPSLQKQLGSKVGEQYTRGIASEQAKKKRANEALIETMKKAADLAKSRAELFSAEEIARSGNSQKALAAMIKAIIDKSSLGTEKLSPEDAKMLKSLFDISMQKSFVGSRKVKRQ